LKNFEIKSKNQKQRSVTIDFFLYKIMNFYQFRALLRQLIVNKIKGIQSKVVLRRGIA
jgi:hypothetical protein